MGPQVMAVCKIKHRLAAGCTNAYYDPGKATQLFVDASLVSVGSVLTQEEKDGKLSSRTRLQMSPVDD